MATTNSSDTAPYLDAERTTRIVLMYLIPCSFIAIVLFISRCTRKGPPAVNIVVSRGDIVHVPQERVIRVDYGDLEDWKSLNNFDNARRSFFLIFCHQRR
jgi:hypothetical protein